MASKVNVQVGDRVQHRAWFWYGSVVEIPETVNYLSALKIKQDGVDRVETHGIPSLILDTNDFIYDWSEPYVSTKVKTKSKSKKSKRKR